MENSFISEMNPDQLIRYMSILSEIDYRDKEKLYENIENELVRCLDELVNIQGMPDTISDLLNHKH